MTVILAKDCNIAKVNEYSYLIDGKAPFGSGSIVFSDIYGKYNLYPKYTNMTLTLDSGQQISIATYNQKLNYNRKSGAGYSIEFYDDIVKALKKTSRTGYTYLTATEKEIRALEKNMKDADPDFQFFVKEGNMAHLNGWTAKDIATDLGAKAGFLMNWAVPNYYVDTFNVDPSTPLIEGIRSLCSMFNPIMRVGATYVKSDNGWYPTGNYILNIIDPLSITKDFTNQIYLDGTSNVERQIVGRGIETGTRFTLTGGLGVFNPAMYRGSTWTQDVYLYGELSWLDLPPMSALIWELAKKCAFKGNIKIYTNTQSEMVRDETASIEMKSICNEIDSVEVYATDAKGNPHARLYAQQRIYEVTPEMQRGITSDAKPRGVLSKVTEEFSVYEALDYMFYAPRELERHVVVSGMAYNINQQGIDTFYETSQSQKEMYSKEVTREFVTPLEYDFIKMEYDEDDVLKYQIKGRLAATCSSNVCHWWNDRCCSLYAGTYNPDNIKVKAVKSYFDGTKDIYVSDFDFNNCLPTVGGRAGMQTEAVCVHFNKAKRVCMLDPKITGSIDQEDWKRACDGSGTWAPTYDNIKGEYDETVGAFVRNPDYKPPEGGCKYYTLGNRDDCPYRSVKYKELSKIGDEEEISLTSVVNRFQFPNDLTKYSNISMLSMISSDQDVYMSMKNMVELDVQKYRQVDKDTYMLTHYNRRLVDNNLVVEMEQSLKPSGDSPPKIIQLAKDVIRTEYNAPNWSVRNADESYKTNIYTQNLTRMMNEPAVGVSVSNIISWEDAQRIKKHIYTQIASEKSNSIVSINGLSYRFEMGQYVSVPGYSQVEGGQERNFPAFTGNILSQAIGKSGKSGGSMTLTIETVDMNITYPTCREEIASNETGNEIRTISGGMYGF